MQATTMRVASNATAKLTHNRNRIAAMSIFEKQPSREHDYMVFIA